MAKTAIYSLPHLPAPVALEILAHLFGKAGMTMVDRFDISIEPDGSVKLAFRSENTSLDAEVDPRWEGMLYQSYNRHPYIARKGGRLPDDLGKVVLEDRPVGDLSRQYAGLIGMAIAESQTRFLMQTEGQVIDKAVALEGAAYVLGVVGAFSSVAQAFARIEWRSNGMTLSCLGVERASPQSAGDIDGNLAIAKIGITPEWGGTQDIALKYPELFESNVDFRQAYALAEGHLLLLKPPVQLEETLRKAVSMVYSSLARYLQASSPLGLALDWQRDGAGFVSIDALEVELPRQDILSSLAASVSQQGEGDGPDATGGTEKALPASLGARAVSVDFVKLAHLEDATSHLRGLLEEHAQTIGHRLELQRLPHYHDSAEVLLDIDQQIDELSIRRDLILGEGAGDWRLLRFPADGLMAFVDYLRRFSLEIIDSGDLRYAFRASQNEPRGVHFLLYRLRDVGAEPAYPAALWKDRLKCGTISHRVDPMFAQFAVSQKARSLVFTPPAHVVVPNFRATQSHVDAYLKQGFGGLFDQADLGEADELESPIYCFGETEQGIIRIEILDGDKFQPIQRVIPFLNDNLEIGHYVDLEAFASEVTERSWRQERLKKLEDANRGLSAKLQADMADVDRALAAQSEQLLGAMAEEVNALRVYLSKITGLMEDLSDRSVALEHLVGESIRNAASYDDMVRKMPGKFAELEQTRRSIQDAIWTEHQNSEAFVQTASRNIGAMRDMILALRKELGKDD
nr:hypothetical protein [uncultured Cohaesibacter sp.]